jgi:hypothetical protein
MRDMRDDFPSPDGRNATPACTGHTFGPFVREVAKQHGVAIVDALAESDSNDPFWAGATPGQAKLAQ